jgi:hypothetical protein
MTELAFESALSLAEKIRHKEISAVELLEFYLQRVEQYNPALNAIIFTQIEKARQQAEGADAALARGENWGAAAWRANDDQGQFRLGRFSLNMGESQAQGQLSGTRH